MWFKEKSIVAYVFNDLSLSFTVNFYGHLMRRIFIGAKDAEQ